MVRKNIIMKMIINTSFHYILRVGILLEDLSRLRTCSEVFQNSFGSWLSDNNCLLSFTK